jgi:Protein of unknown function (DUF3179)
MNSSSRPTLGNPSAPSAARVQAAPPGFDRAAYDRLKLARRLGESIAGWDDPDFAPAAAATFMRPDDYILGVRIDVEARAYPLWIIDYYHVVNDRSGDRRFIVTSCERCGSGSAFWAEPPGSEQRDPIFRAGGLLNAALLLSDARSGSHWIHYEGRGLDRRASGTHLPWIPVVHTEWADWCALHPGTLVWTPPSNPGHPDARHGHGREEFFARPGMEPALLETMTRSLDERYSENEMVLGVGDENASTTYPLREVHRQGGVVQATTPDGPLVIFAGPRPDAISMGAFRPAAGGRPLTFSRRDGAFVDAETSSSWTIEGEAVEGALRGSRLEPVRSFYVRWHAWAGWHPTTELFLSDREPARYGEHPAEHDTSELDDVLSTMAAEGRDVRIVGAVPSQRRPRRSRTSLEVLVDGDRLLVHAFASETAARDYEAVHGARTLLPMRARILLTRLRRIGRSVVEADPDGRYAEPAQIVPTPWSELSWPPVLESETLNSLGPEGKAPDVVVGLLDVVRALRLAGFDIVDVGLLPPAQLRVGCLDGLALTVEADRFLLYLFENDATASAYASTEPHALAFGPFVMRSTPDSMYVHPFYEILYAGDDRVAWSRLLDDERFANIVRAAAKGSDAPSAVREASMTR